MTIKLVVLYTAPADPETFDKHYADVHGPLVDSLPGLLRWDAGRFVGAADGGDLPYYRIAELYFDDQAALASAMGSDQGKATAGDYAQIAPEGSRMFLAELDA